VRPFAALPFFQKKALTKVRTYGLIATVSERQNGPHDGGTKREKLKSEKLKSANPALRILAPPRAQLSYVVPVFRFQLSGFRSSVFPPAATLSPKRPVRVNLTKFK
jgi:hypothetical protein